MGALGFQQYQHQFTAYIRDPKAATQLRGVALRGMKVYAEIVFNNMESTLASCFPVVKKVLGIRRWTALVHTFLAEHRCGTPLFRQIPEEFLHYLERAPEAIATLPPFLYSLAHYEWIELSLTLSDAQLEAGEVADGDLLQGRPVLAPVMALLSYPYPVQRISPRFKPMQPDGVMTYILAFRRQDDVVRFIELNPVSARLLALLSEAGWTGQAALQQIATEMQHPMPEVVIQGGRDILQNLKTEQAILGIWGS